MSLPLPQPRTSFDDLIDRAWRLLNTPRARAEHQAVIPRLPTDSHDDWDRLVDELRCTEIVRVTRREDGSIHVAWFVERRLPL